MNATEWRKECARISRLADKRGNVPEMNHSLGVAIRCAEMQQAKATREGFHDAATYIFDEDGKAVARGASLRVILDYARKFSRLTRFWADGRELTVVFPDGARARVVFECREVLEQWCDRRVRYCRAGHLAWSNRPASFRKRPEIKA